jgi:signal transduction histidine kinase
MVFNFDHPIVIIPIIISLIILTTIVIFLVKGKKSLLLLCFISLMSLMFLWTFGQIGQYISGNNLTIWVSHLIIYTAICFLGVSWLMFVLVYANHPQKSDAKIIILLFISPSLTWLGLLTNPYHHLFFAVLRHNPGKFINSVVVYGPIFWITALFSYIYFLSGIIILVQYIKTQTGQAKKQSIILLLAPILTIISAISGDLYLFVSKDPSPPGYDPTPVFFTVDVLLFTIAVFRYYFLDILPGAFRKVVENIDDAVLIVDKDNYIVNFNLSFRSFFQKLIPVHLNQPITSFVRILREHSEVNDNAAVIFEAVESGSNDPVERDICLVNPERRYFKVKVQQVMNQNRSRGRIVTFSDITEYQRMLVEIRKKNTELSAVNQSLSEHLKIIEELAIANERNRITRELHDSLGHSLMLVIMLMRAGKIESGRDINLTREKLDEGINIAEEGLRELRHSINGLLADEIKNSDIIANLQRLIVDSKPSGILIEFTVFGREYYESFLPSATLYKISDVIYKVTKEAITNALRHGNATKIDVILRFNESKIKLFIVDNGGGCKTVKAGFGLVGMHDRVKTVNGRIVYGSDGEHGFNIHVEIPLEGLKQ